MSIVKQRDPAVMLQDKELPPSKIAISAAVGTAAPVAPPDDRDQLVVLFHAPVPVPLQYLFAIYYP
jgi:hypothetical protein